MAWRDRTLCKSWYTIHPLTVCLEKAMPVDCRAFRGIANVILDGYFKNVTPVCLYRWLLIVSLARAEVERVKVLSQIESNSMTELQ
jgi:hypothetical protein